MVEISTNINKPLLPSLNRLSYPTTSLIYYIQNHLSWPKSNLLVLLERLYLFLVAC